jgi:hypothetical protein
MAQNGDDIVTDQSTTHESFEGANTELLMGMMNCVDTSLFSPQQLQNWEEMKARIQKAGGLKPTVNEFNITTKEGIRTENTTSFSTSPPTITTTTYPYLPAMDEKSIDDIDFRQPLRREASIQDVLACLLNQKAHSFRMMNSTGGSLLLNSEVNPLEDTKPSLKYLLSSNDFSMTEKKESLKHLLSFIDNSFSSAPDPMTNKCNGDAQNGNMKRLSSLQLMSSFITSNPSAQAIGRTTSFEIIQAMLNATSNTAIQKPMTSQDSFRFQHLANCLEAIENDVSADNEDYGAEEVVQVDNLDNLLDYHGPPQPKQTQQQRQQLPTQMTNMFAPSRAIYSEIETNGQIVSPIVPGFDPTQAQQFPSVMTGFNSSMPGMPMPPPPMMENPQAMMYPAPMPPQGYHQIPYQTVLEQTPMEFNGMSMPQEMPQNMMGNNNVQIKQQKQEAQGGAPLCAALGCIHVARVKGMCKVHGGGRRCKIEGCMKSAQTGHLCIAHGGGKPCSVEGCPKTAQSRGLCKQHGGGVRCKYEGCTKSCQSGGYCRGHGGGKRCEYPNCTKWAQKNGHCAKHAQEVVKI